MSYPGGKAGAGVYQRIINLMPPHDVYIEPFLGGGAVLKAKRLARVSFGIDLYRPALEDVHRSATAGNGGDAPRLVDGGSWDKMRKIITAGTAGNGDAGSRSTYLMRGCGLDFLDAFPFSDDTLVYCDPPYLRATRKTASDMYSHEMTDADHARLLARLRNLPCRALISGYRCELYDCLLEDWNSVTYDAMTRGGRTARETLWWNFEKPELLHDTRYVGGDYRERENIRKRIRRWQSRLARMAPLERQAMLQAMREEWPELSISGK